MRVWVTVSVESDDGGPTVLSELARDSFEIADGKFLDRLYILARTTKEGLTFDSDVVLRFDFAL